MIQHFTAYTINCVCHSIRSMFRVLGIYNFVRNLKTSAIFPFFSIKYVMKLYIPKEKLFEYI